MALTPLLFDWEKLLAFRGGGGAIVATDGSVGGGVGPADAERGLTVSMSPSGKVID